jgi:hypothetical protein
MKATMEVSDALAKWRRIRHLPRPCGALARVDVFLVRFTITH